MTSIKEKTAKIISISVLAAAVLASGWMAYLNIDKKPVIEDSSDYLDYEFPDYDMPEVTGTDIDESMVVSPADLPVESQEDQQSVPQTTEVTEEKKTLRYVRIKIVTNLRAGENTSSDKIAVLKIGTELELISGASSRYQVRYAGNVTGWVPKGCCEVFEKEVIIRHVQKYSSGAPINLKGTTEGDEIGSVFKNYRTMGASVAVIENGQVAYRYEYGYANKEKNVKVSENTKFRIASISKVFTSMLAMSAVDDGKLDLDKNLTDVMGFSFYNPSYSKRPVTARMLLTHSAGIRDNDNMFKLKISSVTHNKNFYASPPGTAFLYTNLGMGLAGAVVEKSTDKTISQYAKDRFFDGMGIDASYNAKYLKDTSLVADCYAGTKIDCSSAYLCREQEVGDPGATYHLGQGGLLISAEDLASVFTILLNDGQYNGQQYLSQNAVKEMLTVQQVNTRKNFEQCIGIRKSKEIISGRDMYYHNGAAYGIFSLMAIDPTDKSGIVIITSGADTYRKSNTVFSVCNDVINYCYDEILK